MRIELKWIAGPLGLGVFLGCADAASPPRPGSAPSESRLPDDDTSAPRLPRQPERVGGQTGSGGIRPFGPSCEMMADGACQASFEAGFSAALTSLSQVGSECVPARAIDATLDDVPVCRCDYVSAGYFSDTGDTTSLSYTVGLARRRSILGQPGDSCELRRDYPAFGSVCLLEGAAFSGCTLDEAESSCDAACREVSRNNADVVARSSDPVVAVAAACVQCNFSYCFGVLRAGERCFSGFEYSLGFGYYPAPIPCDGTLEQMLEAQLQASGYLNTCSIYVREESSCTSATPATCEDGGVGDAGGERISPADAARGEAP